MPPTPDDLHFMQQALSLAAATSALASPNPQVGCVLVRDGLILGEGAHLYASRDHAEIVALKQAASLGHATQGATAYVTLEPCSHHGRTPPCADSLIAAGIRRCVIATADPNPLVRGQGIARLRAAGIAVTLKVLQQQARERNEAFAHFILHRRPFVTLKAALSVDGKLAPPPSSRSHTQPHWLTGPAARAQVQRLRHASDAILTGIGTVLADDPLLTDRTSLPRRRPLLRILLDTHLRIPTSSRLLHSVDRDLLILCGSSASTTKIADLRNRGADVQILPEAPEPPEAQESPDNQEPSDDQASPARPARLELASVLKLLGERDILSVLLETGSSLNGAFLQQNLVDKVILFYAETELGPQALPFATGIASPFLFEQTLIRTTRTSFDNDACLTGYLHNPWPPDPIQ